MSSTEELQKKIDKFLKVKKSDGKKNPLGFSPFDTKQQKQSIKVAGKFMKVAKQNPDDPINKVLEAAEQESQTNDPELVRQSLMTFITHDPVARKKGLRVTSLTKRDPGSSVPKKKKSSAPGSISTAAVLGSDFEAYMDWYREDPNLHEHHEHWHMVYGGVPDVNDPEGEKIIYKDRSGEMFVYMHRQMLARYDAERQALAIPLVEPIDDYRAPIKEGYQPNDQLIDLDADDGTGFGSREPNTALGDVAGTETTLETMEESRKNLETALTNSAFHDGTEITVDLLGAILEPSSNHNRSDLVEYYGNGLHASGHVAIAYANGPSKANTTEVDPGVLYSFRTAARDPVFWRWHRHIDNLIDLWENNLEPNDLSTDTLPNIKVQDIVLTFKDTIPISHGETQDQEAEAFGEEQFGGGNFEADISGNQYVTDVLETKMKQRDWVMVEDSGATQTIEYIFPREFYYFFRVENTSSASFDATFRVFLVAEELVDSRRHWVEMDKFKETIPANTKKVVCRDCDMSSVVRQPPQKTPKELDDVTTAFGTVEEDKEKIACDCGMPFHLLLPRGNSDGLKYKLFVMLTDWTKDEVPRLSRCGSISFCGAEGPSEKYPDSKPMGFPFDRPFTDGSFSTTFDGVPNATVKDVTIKWVGDFPEIPYV